MRLPSLAASAAGGRPLLFPSLSPAVRVLVIVGLALLGHLVVRQLRWASERMLSPAVTDRREIRESLARRHPKAATLLGLAVSAVTFGIYFAAGGLILEELGISVTAYLATASVVGLAVAFGSQGLVQDFVIGLTLVFSDVLDVGDLVELSGQVGRVDKIGLRFTSLVDFAGRTIYVPNRSINLVGRFHEGGQRAYVDVVVPPGADAAELERRVLAVARGIREQFRAAVLSEPELVGRRQAGEGGWSYLRLRLHLWPGQEQEVAPPLRARLVARLRELDPAYQDWMVTLSRRVV